MDEAHEEPPDLGKRLFAFALRSIRLCKRLEEKPGVGRTISYQLLKAGTSPGANYEEAQAAQSRPDFISKNCIALKEMRETHYWLRLLGDSQLIAAGLLSELIDEAEQLTRILGSIVTRTRQNPG